LGGTIVAQYKANFGSRQNLQVDSGLPNLCRSRERHVLIQPSLIALFFSFPYSYHRCRHPK